MKRKLRRLVSPLYWGTLEYFSRSPRLAALYYAFVDDSLSREAASVIAGRLRYKRDSKLGNQTHFLLRRNIHRLEKGLIMRPRREVFAVDYIAHTVDVYKIAVSHTGGVHHEEHLWARDVLAQYFDNVDGSHPVIAKQKAIFDKVEATLSPIAQEAVSRTPYIRDLQNRPSVAYDDFMALSMRRRSVRWYRDDPVPRELIDKALDAAKQAPSACNRQPFAYRIFDDPEVARRLTGIPMGTKGFSDKVPAVIVLVGRLRAYPEARDRHAIYIDGALSAMAFMYALETLGVSSCPINWPDAQPQERLMTEALGLEPDERVIMLMSYGWPDPTGMVPFSAKREHAELRSYNV